MKAIFYLTLCTSLVFLFACKNNNVDELVIIDEDYELGFGETTSINGGDFELRFDKLIEDSRCPIYANCVWEGRAVVKLIATKNSEDTDIILATVNSINGDSLLIVEYNNYSIELKDVTPYPDHNNPTEVDDYIVVLDIVEL